MRQQGWRHTRSAWRDLGALWGLAGALPALWVVFPSVRSQRGSGRVSLLGDLVPREEAWDPEARQLLCLCSE